MNNQKIAFITCVNDEAEYTECRYYIEKLHIPEGYCTDIIGIREAISMAQGYNVGMGSTDARYKVYLHQDTFIKNVDFIKELLRIFTYDVKIGLLGVIGNTNIKKGGVSLNTITAWDTGKIVESFRKWNCGIPLQQDIFDGWHFYDISQSMEFRKAGYKIAVPWQKETWCYHDGEYSQKGMEAYSDYYGRFVSEYAKMLGTTEKMTDFSECVLRRKHAEQMVTMQLSMEELFTVCDKDRVALREVFKNNALHEYLCLREYEAIVHIDLIEEEHQSRLRFWNGKMAVSELIKKFRVLKRLLKRIEYGFDSLEAEWIQEKYSRYAINEVCERYVIDKEKVYKRLVYEQCSRVV